MYILYRVTHSLNEANLDFGPKRQRFLCRDESDRKPRIRTLSQECSRKSYFPKYNLKSIMCLFSKILRNFSYLMAPNVRIAYSCSPQCSKEIKNLLSWVWRFPLSQDTKKKNSRSPNKGVESLKSKCWRLMQNLKSIISINTLILCAIFCITWSPT